MLYPQMNKQRRLISLDGFWRFKEDLENIGEERQWFEGLSEYRELAVPGSWNEQCVDLFHFFGKGWYEKEAWIPSEWSDRSVWLRVGSASMNAKVWVNGKFVGEHSGPHLPFEFNIGSLATAEGFARITVLVDNTLDPWSLPPLRLPTNQTKEGIFDSNPDCAYDFFPYGGIHRPVSLYATSLNRIEDITITTDIEGTSGKVFYSVAFTKPCDGELVVKSGGAESRIELKDTAVLNGSILIEQAKLWDVGQPNLYDAEFELYLDGSLVDCYRQSYGIRTVKVEGHRLLLNGKEVFLKGFGKHEDFYVNGKGLNHCLTVKDFDLLKWIGANSFRTTHYPYAEEMLDFADKQGILVIDETPFVGLGDRNYTPEILNKAKTVIRELVGRDKNHPSVIMWSLANEPTTNTEEGIEFFKEMAQLTRSLDGTRPITYVAHREPQDNPAFEYYDVVSINKYYGWYVYPGMIDESLPALEACLQSYYDAFKKPVLVSEFGADAVDGIHTLPDLMFSEEFQAKIIAEQYRTILRKDFCIGAHVWNFADFMTTQGVKRVVFNCKGVFTRERNPKLAAHRLKELWTAEPIEGATNRAGR